MMTRNEQRAMCGDQISGAIKATRSNLRIIQMGIARSPRGSLTPSNLRVKIAQARLELKDALDRIDMIAVPE